MLLLASTVITRWLARESEGGFNENAGPATGAPVSGGKWRLECPLYWTGQELWQRVLCMFLLSFIPETI